MEIQIKDSSGIWQEGKIKLTTDIAKQHNIPIKKDEDLLSMLSTIEINEEIPTQLYKAVAEIFSFIYEISNEKQND